MLKINKNTHIIQFKISLPNIFSLRKMRMHSLLTQIRLEMCFSDTSIRALNVVIFIKKILCIIQLIISKIFFYFNQQAFYPLFSLLFPQKDTGDTTRLIFLLYNVAF